MHLHGSSCRFMLLWSLLVHWPRTVCAQPTRVDRLSSGGQTSLNTFMSITTDGNRCLLQVPHEGQGVRVEMSPSFLLANLIGFQWFLFASKKSGGKKHRRKSTPPSEFNRAAHWRVSAAGYLWLRSWRATSHQILGSSYLGRLCKRRFRG